jgi:hypothetical protein
MCPALPECRIVAIAYLGYAEWLTDNRRYEKADKFLEQMAKMGKTVFEPDDKDLLDGLGKYAMNLRRLHRYDEAINVTEEVIRCHRDDQFLSFFRELRDELRAEAAAAAAARPKLRKARKPSESVPAASRPPAPALSQAERDRLERELTEDDSDPSKSKGKGKRKYCNRSKEKKPIRLLPSTWPTPRRCCGSAAAERQSPEQTRPFSCTRGP